MPSRGALYGCRPRPAPHWSGERHGALDTLAAGGLVAVSADALRRAAASARRPAAPGRAGLGEDRPFDELTRELAAPGTSAPTPSRSAARFSVRGGLVDIFPSTGREPVRVEFFGDSVERLSAFSVFTQRSLRDLDHVLVYPAAEVGETCQAPTSGA